MSVPRRVGRVRAMIAAGRWTLTRREQAKAVFDEIGPWAYIWDTAQTGYLTGWRWAGV